ncbi:MAG TPA: histidine phosphatase family protein [Acidimicrobiales bacterium]|nr:histidine phosphatase family protein [Acidimicrobiales bacterium]
MSVTRLVLVRHGESMATVDQVVGGHDGCTGLSPLGRRQAEALRDRLAATGEVAADLVLTSILPRAVETAEIVAPALGGLAVAQDCDLCEIHPGESDGLSWEEYGRRYNVDMAADPLAPIAPGGESLADFHGRVSKTLLRIADEHAGRTVVLVCHGGVVAGSFHTFFGLPLESAIPVSIWTENTALTEWSRQDDRRWRLVRHNDTAHLVGVER